MENKEIVLGKYIWSRPPKGWYENLVQFCKVVPMVDGALDFIYEPNTMFRINDTLTINKAYEDIKELLSDWVVNHRTNAIITNDLIIYGIYDIDIPATWSFHANGKDYMCFVIFNSLFTYDIEEDSINILPVNHEEYIKYVNLYTKIEDKDYLITLETMFIKSLKRFVDGLVKEEEEEARSSKGDDVFELSLSTSNIYSLWEYFNRHGLLFFVDNDILLLKSTSKHMVRDDKEIHNTSATNFTNMLISKVKNLLGR